MYGDFGVLIITFYCVVFIVYLFSIYLTFSVDWSPEMETVACSTIHVTNLYKNTSILGVWIMTYGMLMKN